MKKFLLILVAINFLVAACTGQPQEPTELVLITDGPTVEEHSPTVTVTKVPTSTSSPTETIIPTASPTARPSHTSTASMEPDILATVVAQDETVLLFTLDSPDELWRAEGVRYECILIEGGEYSGLEIAYEEIILTNQSDKTEIVIDSQQQFCGGMGASGLGGLYWAPNSRYFYYTTAREGVPDGCGWAWQPSVLRYDNLEAEKISLGAGPNSPDGSKLAAWQGRELIVWNLDGTEIGRAPSMTEDAMGPIVWAPDSQALVYLQAENSCPMLSGKSYVVLFDLVTRESEKLLVSEMPTFGGVSWDKPDELNLVNEEGNTWRFDLRTKKLEQTPSP